MYLYLYIYICTYTYVYVYTHIYIYIRVSVSVSVPVPVSVSESVSETLLRLALVYVNIYSDRCNPNAFTTDSKDLMVVLVVLLALVQRLVMVLEPWLLLLLATWQVVLSLSETPLTPILTLSMFYSNSPFVRASCLLAQSPC